MVLFKFPSPPNPQKKESNVTENVEENLNKKKRGEKECCHKD